MPFVYDVVVEGSIATMAGFGLSLDWTVVSPLDETSWLAVCWSVWGHLGLVNGDDQVLEGLKSSVCGAASGWFYLSL
ncbi:hypothetical protein Nepgr_023021 [Nepenthes gracilis]|uniref:Uncharacterized protein n=1 Tax=Nepenthes gracilis TaxID=150966 RepID=A0AAD3XYM8_NEPGR|nr:hypothetical protein Nepgr_023021 [Nepenthes gracilis]